MTKSSKIVELELVRMNSVHSIDDSQKRIVDALSVSEWPTDAESCLIAMHLPASNIGELLQQADNNLNFWGVITTPEKRNGVFIQTNSGEKLVVVFNDSGAVRFAFLEGKRLVEYAVKYTSYLRCREKTFWPVLVMALSHGPSLVMGLP